MKLSETDVELATVDRTVDGYWCLHCETCTRIGDLEVVQVRDFGRTWHDGFCPHCDSSPIDLWEIAGEFQTGEVVDMYANAERFGALREPITGPPTPTVWQDVASFGCDVSIDGGPWEPYWCNVETNSTRKVTTQSVVRDVKENVARSAELNGDTSRIRARGAWWSAAKYQPEDHE